MAPAAQGAGCSRTEEYVAYFAGSAGPPQRSAAGCRRVRMRKLFLRGAPYQPAKTQPNSDSVTCPSQPESGLMKWSPSVMHR